MLTLKNFTAKAGKKTILKNINLNLEKNKIYALMGPNGSGKSTLAYAIMGHPNYRLDKKSRIIFRGKPIQNISADERARRGIFLSFQTPFSLAGVTIYQLLQAAQGDKNDPRELKSKIEEVATALKIEKNLLERPLNKSTSGGEKKKLELLQAAILSPHLLILDEVDTGVDVDALKTIAGFLKKQQKNKTYLVITHYNRILKYLKADQVLVMVDGRIVKTGGPSLAEKIEKKGYGLFTKE